MSKYNDKDLEDLSYEELKEIRDYDCREVDCFNCKWNIDVPRDQVNCLSTIAASILLKRISE